MKIIVINDKNDAVKNWIPLECDEMIGSCLRDI